jgi:hypothetical protein
LVKQSLKSITTGTVLMVKANAFIFKRESAESETLQEYVREIHKCHKLTVSICVLVGHFGKPHSKDSAFSYHSLNLYCRLDPVCSGR